MKKGVQKTLPAFGFKKRHLVLILGILVVILLQSIDKRDKESQLQLKETESITYQHP